jgi:hypothetical protein
VPNARVVSEDIVLELVGVLDVKDFSPLLG